MTNTNRPASTASGIVCGRCSNGYGKDRVLVRHANVEAVRVCFNTPDLPTIEQMSAVFEAPEAKPFGRWTAACPRKGCKTHAVKAERFTLKCSNHGKTVWTPAKQLFGQLSKAAHHKCDDRCMYARGAVCVCACGGVNHGLGWLVKL